MRDIDDKDGKNDWVRRSSTFLVMAACGRPPGRAGAAGYALQRRRSPDRQRSVRQCSDGGLLGYCESGSIRLGGLDLLVFLVLPPEKAVAFLGVQLAVFGLYMGPNSRPTTSACRWCRLARAAAMPALPRAAASTSEPNASNLSAPASNRLPPLPGPYPSLLSAASAVDHPTSGLRPADERPR